MVTEFVNSSSPLYHFKSAKGLPAIEIHVIRRTWSSIRTVSLLRPVMLGAPGGSKTEHRIVIFYLLQALFLKFGSSLLLIIKSCNYCHQGTGQMCKTRGYSITGAMGAIAPAKIDDFHEPFGKKGVMKIGQYLAELGAK